MLLKALKFSHFIGSTSLGGLTSEMFGPFFLLANARLIRAIRSLIVCLDSFDGKLSFPVPCATCTFLVEDAFLDAFLA